tara:strand:+ start:2210 stop:3286 length:1077 start_codon:yes stop_codon:yes gene_type:complete
MLAALDIGANPSSVHSAGRAARKCVETARAQLAQKIGARGEDIVFTSGGTEANALALIGATRLIDNPVILSSDIEHPAVKAAIEQSGAKRRYLRIDSNGRLDISDLAAQLAEIEDETPLLSIMLANNETGVIQPVAEAAALLREKNGLVHCDAVQALGKINVNAGLLGVDYLSFSAHKFGGPQGAGALWFRVGAPLKPQQLGGGQERSLRSGTENISGIAGFGAALAAVSPDEAEHVAKVRDLFESLVSERLPVKIFGKTALRLPGTSNLALEGFRGETQVMAMDLAGIAVSSGSACSSGKVKRSDVLMAMGVSEDMAECAIRVSFGWASTLEDAERAAKALITAASRAVPGLLKENA